MRLFKKIGKVRGVAVKLFRDAAYIDAGTAHIGYFSQAHARAALPGHARSANAAATAANDEKIKIKCLHRVFLRVKAPPMIIGDDYIY